MDHIYLCSDLFDHGIFVFEETIECQNVLSRLISEIHLENGLVTESNWINVAELLFKLSKDEAESVFKVFSILSSFNTPDIKLIHLVTQLFICIHHASSVGARKAEAAVWPKQEQSFIPGSPVRSPSSHTSSPRSPTASPQVMCTQSDRWQLEQSRVAFMKTHLCQLLLLIKEAYFKVTGTEITEEISMQIMDELDYLFYFKGDKLSSQLSCFSGSTVNSVEEVASCAAGKMAPTCLSSSNFENSKRRDIVPTSLFEDDDEEDMMESGEKPATFPIHLERVAKSCHIISEQNSFQFSRSTSVPSRVWSKRRQESNLCDCDFDHCEASTLYCLLPAGLVHINACSNCTIVVPSAVMVSLTCSDNVTVITSAKQVRLLNCVDSNIFMFTPNPICLSGANRNIKVAPFNTTHPDLDQWLVDCDVLPSEVALTSPSMNLWAKATAVGNGETAEEQIQVLPPLEFKEVIIPLVFGEKVDETAPSIYFALPDEYASVIIARSNLVTQLREQVAEANVSDAQQKMLMDVLHAHFRNWLIETGHIREIADLVRLERSNLMPVFPSDELEELFPQNDDDDDDRIQLKELTRETQASADVMSEDGSPDEMIDLKNLSLQ